MKKFIVFFFLLIGLMSCNNRATQVSSPDGNLILSFQLTESGQPTYTLYRAGEKVIDASRLGLLAEEGNLAEGFEVVKAGWNKVDETWETVWGEERYIRDCHNEMTIQLRQSNGTRMNVVFRLFNDGFAFRYVFPDENTNLTITDDQSEYCFVSDHQAWSIPWRTEYYEGLWHRAPLSEKDTMCSPITIELNDGSYAFLHEAAITNYPAQNLYTEGTTVRCYLTPWLDENKQTMDVKAYIQGAFATPWHMLVLTNTLPELVASRVMLNLNEPCKIEDTSWIRPMKFIGIWWGMHLHKWTWRIGPIHGATTENMKQYLDFAADHHIQAVLAEGWNTGWEGYEGINNDRFSFVTPYADYDMEYLTDYAHSRGVEIVFHHETSGRADEYEADLDTAFQYMQAHGMHAVKTGYVSPIVRTTDGYQWNKGQSGVRHYRKVIETAARYHVAIDNHEPVMPSGLQRTYPNLMTQEGIRGQEWNAWSRDGGSPCEHVTVLPFTRFMAGPADYTPGVFHFENPIIPGTRVHATLMNQLGLFVCMYSPLQMACDLPESYMEHPEAFRFIERVPCDWEQSRLLDGRIGDYMVMARQERGTADWFVGGITDEEAREVTVALDFLEPNATYSLTLYHDAEDADWVRAPYAYNMETREVKKGDAIDVKMASGGGFAMSIEKK